MNGYTTAARFYDTLPPISPVVGFLAGRAALRFPKINGFLIASRDVSVASQQPEGRWELSAGAPSACEDGPMAAVPVPVASCLFNAGTRLARLAAVARIVHLSVREHLVSVICVSRGAN